MPESVLFTEVTPKGTKGLPVDDLHDFQEGSAEEASYLRKQAKAHGLEFGEARLVHMYARANNIDFAAAMEAAGIEGKTSNE